MPRLKGSADLLEDRRRRALALWDRGLSLNEVGRRIHCAAGSVLRWAAAVLLMTEQNFRKLMGYQDLWMLKAVLGRKEVRVQQGVA